MPNLFWATYLRTFAAPLAELEQFPELNPHKQRRILSERLFKQVRHFSSRPDALPEWKEAAVFETPEKLWREWTSLPIVTKSLLQTRFHPSKLLTLALNGRIGATGGSTGEPTSFLHDRGMVRAMRAQDIFTRLRMGWRPGMTTIKLWGSDRDIGKGRFVRQQLVNRLRGEIAVEGFRIDVMGIDEILKVLKKRTAVAIFGFSSMLEHLARGALQRGVTPHQDVVRTAWNGGEMLLPTQVSLFQSAFGTPILNRYGGRELSTIACQYTHDGGLQVLRPWVFLEVVDDNGKPASPGQPGRILCTSTVCRGTPFLRYEVGDMGAYSGADVSESGICALTGLHGRIAGILRLPDGRTINNIFWNHLMKEFGEIRQFQVVLKGDQLVQLLFTGDGLEPHRELALRERIGRMLGNVPIHISRVTRIPLTPNGKHLQVVREPRLEVG